LNFDNKTDKSEERYQALQKISVIATISNILLTVFKIFIGIISGSGAVLSDGIHSFSDVFATIMIMVGLKLSNEKADREHPYGHQRIESVVSVFLAVFLGITAFLLGYGGLTKLISGDKMEPSVWAVTITVVSIVWQEFMFQYTYRQGKKYNSTSIIADAWHHRSDSISSLAVLVGVVGVFFGIMFLESIATIFVCFLILYVAFGICKSAISQLIDQSADKEARSKIESVILSADGVKKIDLLKTRLSNNIVFVEVEISVDSSLTVVEGHNIAKSVHDKLEALPELKIEHCMVHVNPFGQSENTESTESKE